jgi:methionyl-tRNA formyltransferase
LRLIFMGTPAFSVPALEALIQAGHKIVAVYCQPPRPANRGHKLQACAVEEAAHARGLPVYHPKTLRHEDAQDVFRSHGADLGVVVAYGLILPKAILDAPTHGCINIHASLLPRWRGAAPLQRAIQAGDARAGVTTMQMDEGLDTGDMLLWDSIPLTAETTTPLLHDALSHMGARLIVDTLNQLKTGTLIRHPQPEEGVTYAHKISKEEAELDWRAPADVLARQIRAFTPWPGTFFHWNGETIKVLEAQVVPFTQKTTRPGTLLDSDFTICCGRDAIAIKRLQRPGKAPLSARDFLNGVNLPVGTGFEISSILQEKEPLWDATS